MARWVELAGIGHDENAQPVLHPAGKFVDLDKAQFFAAVRLKDHNGALTESWAVKTDQGVLADSQCGSEDDARAAVSALIETGGPTEKPARSPRKPRPTPAGSEATD